MKWRRGKRSPNLRDRRSEGGGFAGGGGSPIPLPGGRVGGGIGTMIVLLIIYLVFLRGGSDGGFDIPDPSGGFPQAPASGEGQGEIPQGPDADEHGLLAAVDLVPEGLRQRRALGLRHVQW